MFSTCSAKIWHRASLAWSMQTVLTVKSFPMQSSVADCIVCWITQIWKITDGDITTALVARCQSIKKWLTNLQVIVSIPFQLFFGIDRSCPAVNPETLPDTAFTSAVATNNAVFDVCIRTNIIVIRHDTVHSETEVGRRQARYSDSILEVKEARSFIVLIRHRHNNARRWWQRRQTVVTDCHLATITMAICQ